MEQATLQADDQATLDLAAAAETLFAPGAEDGLDARFALRRLLLERGTRLRESHPERHAAISARIERFARVLSASGLSPADLDSGTVRAELAASAFAALLVALFLAPPALVGLAAHAPAYNLIGPLARRLSRGDTDIVATIKVLGAFLFFPLTWIALGPRPASPGAFPSASSRAWAFPSAAI